MVSARHVTIGEIEIGNDMPLTLIAGPRTLESRGHALETSHALTELASEFGTGLIYKSAFQWPDRPCLASDCGMGMKKALPIFAEVRETYGCPVLTDVHEAQQCIAVAEAVDVLQIPAPVCRQADLLIAAAETGRAVNVKKGQFLSPWNMKNVAAKIERSGNSKILLCERGVSFGYDTVISDMRALPILADTGYPVVFDTTHSMQHESRQGTCFSGQCEILPMLARAAVAVGVAALLVETHQESDRAPNEEPYMVHLSHMRDLLGMVLTFDSLAKRCPASLGEPLAVKT